jgi:hypothetical protein
MGPLLVTLVSVRANEKRDIVAPCLVRGPALAIPFVRLVAVQGRRLQTAKGYKIDFYAMDTLLLREHTLLKKCSVLLQT